MTPEIRDVLIRADALLRQPNATLARRTLEHFAASNEVAKSSAEFQAMLAQARLLDGDASGALEAIDRALRIRTPWAEASQIRALALRDKGELDEAKQAIEVAIRLRPQDARALANLGSIELRRGELREAERALRQALAISPYQSLAWSGLAETLQAQGKDDEATDAWRQWLTLEPESPRALARFGWALAKAHRWSEAEEVLSASVQSSDADSRTAIRLAFVRRERGDTPGALDAYARARSLAPDSLTARFGAALVLPQVYEDVGDLERWRARYAMGLDELASDAQQFHDPHHLWHLDWSNFYLGYQGRNDLELQRLYAGVVSSLADRAAPQWRMNQEPGGGGSRVRVGFASSFFRTCTVGAYFHSWLTSLDPKVFDVHVFQFGNEFDELTESLRGSVGRFVRAGPDVRQIASTIRASNLDVLVYPQLGMDGRDSTLAALRLAPVQCAAWGHPETTGSETIDFFFSCEDMEPAGASQHYSERLLLLPGLGTRYALPSTRHARRVEFGLPEACRLYVCPHSLFKIHPDNDAMFADLLARDEGARLVICADGTQPASRLFLTRLRRGFASRDIAADERVIVQPLRPPPEFRALLSVCDVMLDTLHWSGGNTSLDALAAGLPIVSAPGALMRGRQSAAMLRLLGHDQLIASTPSEAVSKAIEVASDKGVFLRGHIQRERGALFERPEPLARLAEHLLNVRR